MSFRVRHPCEDAEERVPGKFCDGDALWLMDGSDHGLTSRWTPTLGPVANVTARGFSGPVEESP